METKLFCLMKSTFIHISDEVKMKSFYIFLFMILTCFTTSCDDSEDETWRDPETGYTWSSKVRDKTWNEAVEYCNNLSEGGHKDWLLPTISKLRTLITSCSATVTGGTCKVSDTCLLSSCKDENCNGCTDLPDGYSKLGDTEGFWSSSTNSDLDESVWVIYIGFAKIDYIQQEGFRKTVRCVR